MQKPSIAELLSASGYTTYTPELIQRAMSTLYGHVGANVDARDWSAILQSPHALEAAEAALLAMYQSSAYLLGNTQHLEQSGYVAAQAEITYRQLAERLGFTHQPSWSQGTAYDNLGPLTMAQLVALVPVVPSVPADSTAPTIISVAITAASGVQNDTLNAGDVLSVTVTMSEATTVTTTGGTPQLALDIGGTTVQASYASGSGSTALVFTCTIQAGQADANGIAVAANSLSANGGTLKDGAGNHATLTHTAVAANASYMVDAVVPVATLNSMVQLEPTGVTNGNDYTPQIAAVGSSGEFVVTWHGQDSAGGDTSIYVQKFNADGTATGAGPVPLEPPGVTNGYDYSPQVAAVGSSGEFVVTWYGEDSAGGDFSIYVQKFNADGTATGAGPVQLEPPGVTNGNDSSPQIAAVGSSGEFVVTWQGQDSAGDYSIFVQKFNANGTTTGQAQVQLEATGVTTGGDYSPQIAAVGSSGEFVVTWRGQDSAGDYSIFVQKFNADGTTTGQAQVQLEAIGKNNGYDREPQIIAVGSSGEFVVTWYGEDSAGDYSIFVQKFNADGTATGAGPVPLEPPGVTNGADYYPQIAAVGSSGAFVVTWYGEDSAGGDTSIFVQKFNADGTATGAGPVQLEPPGVTNGGDSGPQVAAVGSSGAFVVTWYGKDSAGGDTSIFVQKFDADGQPVPGAALVNPGALVQVRSSEVGAAYLVKSTMAVTSLADITGAADAQWNQVAITAANTDTALTTAGLGDGTYHVYTADAAGNLSAPSGTVTIDGTAPVASAFTATAIAVGATSNENGTLGLYDASHQLLAKTGGGTLSTVLTAGTAATITVEAQAHITSATLKVSDAAGKFASDSRTVVLGTNAPDAALVGTDNADFIFGFAGADTLTGGAGADRFVYAAGDAGSWTFHHAGGVGTPEQPVQGSQYSNLEAITDFNIVDADTLVLGNASLSSVDIGGPGAQADDIVVVYGRYDSFFGFFTVGDQATPGVTNGDAIVLWDGDAAGGLQLEAVVLVGVDLSKTPTLSGLKELTFA